MSAISHRVRVISTVMTEDLQISLAADRALDKAIGSADCRSAYESMLAEVEKSAKLLPKADKTFAQSTQIEKSLIESIAGEGGPGFECLSLGFAQSQFDKLDKDKNGQLELSELQDKGAVSSLPNLDARLKSNLAESFRSLKNESTNGSWWNLNLINPDAITKEDLGLALNHVNKWQKEAVPVPLYAGGKSDMSGLSPGLKSLLESRGVTIKYVDGTIGQALAHKVSESPILAIAQAVYNPPTREIISQKGPQAEAFKDHEIGHAVDDALAGGGKYFSQTKEFNYAVDKDLAAIKAVRGFDSRKALPGIHLFIQSQLDACTLSEGARKELFAEIFQSADKKLASGVRSYFPNAAKVVEDKLAIEGVGR